MTKVSNVRLAWRVALLAVLAGAAVVVGVVVGVPSLGQLRSSFVALGPWAGVVFAALYAGITLSPLPKTVFTVAAGALFGVPVALVVVLLGASCGAVVAFGLARLLGRDMVYRLVGARAAHWDRQMARRGFWAVLAARLVPIVPFTAVNYLAGVTSLRLRDFMVGTVLGILPATTAYIVVGAYGSRPGSWPLWAALSGLALLTVAGLLAGWRRRRRPTASANVTARDAAIER